MDERTANAAGSARLFVALWPDAAVRAALRAESARWWWAPQARVVAPEKLHLTVHFLGAVDPSRVPEIAAALDIAFDAFELRFGRAEFWPHGLAVLVPWEPSSELLRLHDTSKELLRRLELPTEERGFRPHVTLARRAAGSVPEQPAAFGWPVTRYALVEAMRDGTGYAVRHTWESRKRADRGR